MTVLFDGEVSGLQYAMNYWDVSSGDFVNRYVACLVQFRHWVGKEE